jgi:hypothetical protein
MMHSNALRSFKADLSLEQLSALFREFLFSFLGECCDEPSFIVLTTEHRDKIIELAQAAYKESVYQNQIVDWSIEWEKGGITPDKMLEIYLCDNCRPPEKAESHRQNMKALPYKDFLHSDYWDIVRLIVIDRYGEKCALCGNPDHLHVHHRDYSHHGEEHKYLEDLIPLCRSCHEKFHDKLPVTGVPCQ